MKMHKETFGIYLKHENEDRYIHVGTGCDLMMSFDIARGLHLLAKSLGNPCFPMYVVDKRGVYHEVTPA
jgi:hypothetical protein